MKNAMTFALGALLSLGAASSAWAAGEATRADGDRAAAPIVVSAKQAGAAIDEFIVTAKRVNRHDEARTPPAMPIEMPRLEFAIPAPPVVRL